MCNCSYAQDGADASIPLVMPISIYHEVQDAGNANFECLSMLLLMLTHRIQWFVTVIVRSGGWIILSFCSNYSMKDCAEIDSKIQDSRNMITWIWIAGTDFIDL